MEHPQLDLFAGIKAQEEGMRTLEEVDKNFLSLMRTRARQIAADKGSLTTDDLRVYGQMWNIHPDIPKAWGAIFLEEGWICIGRRPSAWKSNHGRKINIWARKVQ